MTDNIDRYLEYLDSMYDRIVTHLVGKSLPLDDERVRLYFGELVRPYYFWAQEEKPQEEVKPATRKQIEYLQTLRKWGKHQKTDDELNRMSSQEASALIESCGGKRQ